MIAMILFLKLFLSSSKTCKHFLLLLKLHSVNNPDQISDFQRYGDRLL